MNGPRQANDQEPLGELLRHAREKAGLSRAEVAQRAGITVNSLSKYERAGEEEDGYYPSSQKLASLCYALNLNPLKAIMSCMSRDEFWSYKGRVWEDDLLGHPDHEYVVKQYFALTESNRALSEIINVLMVPDHERTEEQQQYVDWYRKEAERRLDFEAEFIRRTQRVLNVPALEPHGFSWPGRPDIGGNGKEEDVFDYAQQKGDPGK